MAAFWWLALSWLGLASGVLEIVTIAIKFVAAVAGVWGAYRLVDVISSALERKAARTENKFDDLLVPLVRKSAKVFVIAFGLIFIADTLRLSISGMLAGLGLAGMAIALAAQDTVKNFFGSLTVVLDRPFQVGDWCLIDDTEGSVEEVGFRSTRVRTFYNSIISIPNAKLLTATVDNMGARRYRRWKTKLGVTYDTSPEKLDALCEGIRELVRYHPYTRKDYFQVHVVGLADFSIEILLYLFFETPNWTQELKARHNLILDMLRLAERLEVQIAFPTQTLHMVQEPGDGSPPTPPIEPGTAREVGRKTARSIVVPPTTRFEPAKVLAGVEKDEAEADAAEVDDGNGEG
jgi:MscS family membrane protein